MNLVLDIEHLLGVAFAARGQDSEAPDWPPQPDRVFSALVAAWGARGEREGERGALQWLEAQPAPDIIASPGYPRTAPIVFVPPNDPEGGRVGNAAVMPALRRRQARRFPVFRPDDPVVSLVWREAAPNRATLASLNALAADTAYVGHSASLTRCRFRIDGEPAAGEPAQRRVYAGRLAELERGFHARPPRRPSPESAVRAASKQERPIQGVFSGEDKEWLVLEHVDGEMPDIRAAALVAKAIRDTLMSGYGKAGLGDAIPAVVSGHSPDGRPTSEPHLVIAPLAFVGASYASGIVYGFALIPPANGGLFEDGGFRSAIRAISTADQTTSRRVLNVHGNGIDLTLALGAATDRRSLDPAPYLRQARLWASCTPIVLDRHLKSTGNEARQQEMRALIKQACINAGLPEPAAIAAGKHSAVEGTPSAYPSAGEPHWMRWRLPASLASRQLIHAVVDFGQAVRGPVILGAGRFMGLGLCRRVDVARQR
ncbi:MAG TPA: type I-U CRISPR-associated protein Csb2 [Stellaceae bacterium]|nr:type I-U CRISPR-associated protein Csb2 [Stellaceae bacterium]